MILRLQEWHSMSQAPRRIGFSGLLWFRLILNRFLRFRNLMANAPVSLDLTQLSMGMPGLSPAYGGAMAEAAAVCLDDCGHTSGVRLNIEGDVNAAYALSWLGPTDQARRTWADEQFATEQGAYGVAILVVGDVRGYKVVERSRKGTGFDYWLGDDVGGDLFAAKARLEVSGIRRGDSAAVTSRARQKTSQIAASSALLPGVVAVIEFGQPIARVLDRV